MNNHISVGGLPLLSADIVQAAALVAEALKSGRAQINPDGSLKVDGIQIPPAPPASGEPVATNPESENKFLFDGKTWTLQFDGKVVVELDTRRSRASWWSWAIA